MWLLLNFYFVQRCGFCWGQLTELATEEKKNFKAPKIIYLLKLKKKNNKIKTLANKYIILCWTIITAHIHTNTAVKHTHTHKKEKLKNKIKKKKKGIIKLLIISHLHNKSRKIPYRPHNYITLYLHSGREIPFFFFFSCFFLRLYVYVYNLCCKGIY